MNATASIPAARRRAEPARAEAPASSSKRPGLTRRNTLKLLGRALAGLGALFSLRPLRGLAEKMAGQTEPATSPKGTPEVAASLAPKGYNPKAHRWAMAIDLEKCIGCGSCARACKEENNVIRQPFYFRTWVERYLIKKAKPGSGEARGEVLVDSPNGGVDGFPPMRVPKEDILRSFYVPKLCNHCDASPCTQSCPVGATFEAPDGVVLVDPKYCIGCGFCVQACPYGCRFFNPITRTAEKCTFCYHRTTRGLLPACVEVCPTGTRVFGDLKDTDTTAPFQRFIQQNRVGVLKPHLRTHPHVLYAALDKDIR